MCLTQSSQLWGKSTQSSTASSTSGTWSWWVVQSLIHFLAVFFIFISLWFLSKSKKAVTYLNALIQWIISKILTTCGSVSCTLIDINNLYKHKTDRPNTYNSIVFEDLYGQIFFPLIRVSAQSNFTNWAIMWENYRAYNLI